MNDSTVLERAEEEALDEFDVEDMLMGPSEDDAMLEMLGHMAKIDHHQTQAAVELTRMIIGNAGAKEKEVLSTFKKAKAAVSSCSPLQEIWERMSGQ